MSYPFPGSFNATPDLLYHYTTVSGLEGILASSTLFATHIGYLNDAEEMKHGVKQIEQLLAPSSDLVAAVAMENPGSSRQVVAGINRLRSEFTSSHHQSLVKQPYVTCLSEVGDQLSQWRGYGGRGGYAIHFDTKLLRKTVRLKGLDGAHLFGEFNLLQQIAYHPDEASVYLAGILDRFADAIGEQLEEPEGSTRDVISLSYEFSLIELQNAIAVMKNPAFDEEREFRIVSHPPDDTWDPDSCFHSASDIGLIPRIRLSFHPGCITGVTVGPGENMELRKKSLEHYFEVHYDKYPNVQVMTSEVPFRPI
ncbi:DUF2971 domain-containing protein [Arthrobacter sp. SLBN-53]|uniref:DUF2971 domain-containing protein n=1 Tax=Arthrobacter sp. SLBN-53 TaxID=2768412 RepID=UPI0011518439|nr:DUF2971 domain-containing protein [Arthrobacter sp. SLBN-53]TQK30214.1 hypothetical protein FBY28_3233 [Arthrobacter sp. SLBN-53]